MKEYKITTYESGATLIFLTTAKNIRDALKKLIENSYDFRDVGSISSVVQIKIERIGGKK